MVKEHEHACDAEYEKQKSERYTGALFELFVIFFTFKKRFYVGNFVHCCFYHVSPSLFNLVVIGENVR